ncbi:MAG: hypothetical protein U0V18_09280 [Anaerolineales bacterium]
MNLQTLSLALKATKIVIVALLLGLGVHFGILMPAKNYNAVHTGIFGSFYKQVVWGTLLLFILYRVSVLAIKSRLPETSLSKMSKRKKQENEVGKTNKFYKETILFICVILPIAIGNGITNSPLASQNSMFFQALKFVFSFIIFSSIYMIYNEDVNFQRAG